MLSLGPNAPNLSSCRRLQIQKGLIDMENMFELLDTKPAVDDAPDACQLAVTRGDVAFDHVTFRCAPVAKQPAERCSAMSRTTRD